MLNVETIDLSVHGIQLPHEHVAMVLAQPYLPRGSFTAAEPYSFRPAAKPGQLDMLRQTLSVAQANHHQAGRTHFTLLPEYSVPFPEGINLINDELSGPDWPVGTIVIGGTDGLTHEQYETLVGSPLTTVSALNAADRVNRNEWVNCAIVWIKASNNAVHRWVQPKVHPAWEERDVPNQHMFCGKSAFLFRGFFDNGVVYMFGALVCFDWIANVDGQRAFRWMMADVHRQAGIGQLPVTWMFVIERNRRPSHDTFLGAVTEFFDPNVSPNAIRTNTCLVFANAAGRVTPGRVDQFGASSLIHSPQAPYERMTCPPTLSNGGHRFRDGSSLIDTANCIDVVFRERGACIHSFLHVNPAFTVGGAAGRRAAVERASVHSVNGIIEPRAPAQGVPAAVKWLNDELDELPSVSVLHPDSPIAGGIDTSHHRNVQELRLASGQYAESAVRLSAQEASSEANADQWDEHQQAGLRHMLHTLDIVGVGADVQAIGVEPVHAVLERADDELVDLVAVRGSSHKKCKAHMEDSLPVPRRRTLLVSRDTDNTPWYQKYGDFLDVPRLDARGEREFTDPTLGTVQIGYQDLLSIFLNAHTANDIAEGIDAKFAA